MKKIIITISLLILIPIILFISYKFISNKLNEINASKIKEKISDLSKEKIDYVFIEINPSLVLTIKDNKVDNIACLNDDCLTIYNDINVLGKDINESTDNIYNVTKEKGFNVTNGIKIKVTGTIEIKEKENLTIEYINENTKNELLTNIKNNDELLEENNENYYTKLWNELKKDKDYNEVYTCNIENEELKCNITYCSGINKDSDYNNKTLEFIENLFLNSTNKVLNTLAKFDFDIKENKVIINDLEYTYTPLFTCDTTSYKNALTKEKIDILDNEICDFGMLDYTDGVCQSKDGIYIIPLENVNLLNKNRIQENIIICGQGMTENTLKNYELYKELNS